VPVACYVFAIIPIIIIYLFVIYHVKYQSRRPFGFSQPHFYASNKSRNTPLMSVAWRPSGVA
jgi:hypothetical protein